MQLAPGLIFTDTHPEGSLPLSFLTITGPNADAALIESKAASAKGLIIALDGEQTMPEPALNVFMPSERCNSLDLSNP